VGDTGNRISIPQQLIGISVLVTGCFAFDVPSEKRYTLGCTAYLDPSVLETRIGSSDGTNSSSELRRLIHSILVDFF